MRYVKYLLSSLILISCLAHADINDYKASMTIEEEDGVPSGRPRTLKVSNGDLTDNGDRTFSLKTASAVTETDPLSLHLDQSTPQTVTGGKPIFADGLRSDEQTLLGGVVSPQVSGGSGGIDADTKLYVKFDGVNGANTAPDETGVHTLTFVGTAQLSNLQKAYAGDGTSLLLDGNSDYITIPDSANLRFGSSGTGEFTVDFWVRFTALPAAGNFATLVSHYTDGNNELYWYLLNTAGTYSIACNDYHSGSNVIAAGNTSPNVSTDTWYHIALIRSGNTFGMYQNGVQIGYTSSAYTFYDHTGTFRIGYYSGGKYLNGNVAHFRTQWSNIFSASPNVGKTDTITVPTAPYSTGGGAATDINIHAIGTTANPTPTWLTSDSLKDLYIEGKLEVDDKIYADGGVDIISDSKGLTLGAASDATLLYNGTNLVINPKAVGSGLLSILGDISLLDEDMVLGTTTGTKFGTATTQKLSFFNSTPIVQPLATTDLGTVLSNLGLRVAGTAYPITTSGAVSFTGTIGLGGQVTVSDAVNFALNATTGTKIGTATTQKLGFYNATPVVQQLATADLGVALSNLGLRATGTAYPVTTTGKASLGEIDWTGGNITYVPVGSSIQTYIDAATAGDTLILGSGAYTASAAITVNKALAIIGQGEETVITTSHLSGIYVTVSDVLLSNFILNTSATGTIFGVQVNATTGGVISNVHTKDVQINITGNPTNSYGLRYANTSGTIKNVKIRTTATVTSQYGMVLSNYAAAATPTTVIVENADIEVTSPDATTSIGVYVLDSSATQDVTAHIYNSRIKSAGAATGNAVWAAGDDTFGYVYNCILNGFTWDIRQSSSATCQLTNCILVNNLKTGTITYGGVINNGKAFFADDVSIGLDSKKLFWGTANDASINYDGTNLLINPRDVGTGNVIIGSTSTGVKATQGGLDISSGGNALILGADNNTVTRTDTTAKASRLGGYHYTNAEEPFAFLLGLSTSTNNELSIGGGSAAFNTATLLRFYTAATTTTVTGTERMRIASDGKVGIGTTAPGALLDVSSTVTSDGLSPTTLRISGLFSGDWTVQTEMANLEFYNNDGSTGGANVRGKISSIVEHINGLHWGLGFYTATNNAAPTEKVRITNAGNVGIGTTAPSNKLHLYSSLADDKNTFFGLQIDNQDNGSTAEAGIKFGVGDSAGALLKYADIVLQRVAPYNVELDLTNSGSFVVSGGNVGIGTTTPAQLLHVNGIIRADDKIIFTQADGNEYIDSLADGYMDYGATTQHRFNNDVDVDGDVVADSISAVHKTADGTAAVANGTYVMGIGTATNGTITIVDGVITAVTECTNA